MKCGLCKAELEELGEEHECPEGDAFAGLVQGELA